MQSIDLQQLKTFIEEHIGPDFHDKKLAKLKKINTGHLTQAQESLSIQGEGRDYR